MLDSFSFALRHELKDTGVTVTCLMPGPTDTEFFARADMLDTKVGQAKKDDPAEVARDRLRRDDEGAGRRRQRMEEQASDGHRHRDAIGRPGRDASRHGGTGTGKK